MSKKLKKRDDIERTPHGETIADQIQGQDVYGYDDALNASDLWYILDNLQTHFLDTKNKALMNRVTQWLRELEKEYPDMETI